MGGRRAADPPAIPPPRGEAVRVPVTRDTWFSAVGEEADCNLGGSNKLNGGDTADPPLEYRCDVTAAVRDWVTGASQNHGLALAPVIDRAADDGQYSRFQVYASEYRQQEFTPKLTIEIEP